MLPSPRVIVVDDELDHLQGLARCLNSHGVACLEIHFTGDSSGLKPCPDVRIIFADLHLAGPASNPDAYFATIGGLLEETIQPSGPYFIVLWTVYPDQASALLKFLEDRLQRVTKPFDILPLEKGRYLDEKGLVEDEEALMAEIQAITERLPQIGALFNWERRVLEATGKTLASVLELASAEEVDKRASEVGRILANLASGAVGQPHVEEDRFRAVNDALLPVLADRIASLRKADGDRDVWEKAFDPAVASQNLSVQVAARLNQLAHIDVTEPGRVKGSDPGAIVPLPESFRKDFGDMFGIDEREAAKTQFRCKAFDPQDGRFRWVLVQAQAACDHAQTQPGSLPYYLGLDFPHACVQRNRTSPEPLWESPVFQFDDESRVLHVSARFPMGMSHVQAQGAMPLYRLREQILNHLIYRIHGHGARPGMISFRGQ